MQYLNRKLEDAGYVVQYIEDWGLALCHPDLYQTTNYDGNRLLDVSHLKAYRVAGKLRHLCHIDPVRHHFKGAPQGVVGDEEAIATFVLNYIQANRWLTLKTGVYGALAQAVNRSRILKISHNRVIIKPNGKTDQDLPT